MGCLPAFSVENLGSRENANELRASHNEQTR
jgi:hypothetical protein